MGRNPPFFPVGTQWETRGKNRQQGLGKKGFPQKKVLSLVLCVAMMLSVMVMSTGAASFTDQDEFSENYAEAAEVLTGMGVINGYEDGSFQPKDNITRAEVAAMIYRVATGDVDSGHPGMTAGANYFTDVSEDDWYAGYVNYCADAGYIKGFEDNTFRADENVTGYQVLAMILRAVGYDKNNEYTGVNWTLNVASTAMDLKLLKNVDSSVSLTAEATRELVAEFIFQAIRPGTYTVDYVPAVGDYRPDTRPASSLGEQVFDLDSDDDADAWGRPATVWYADNDKANGQYDKDDETVYATIEEEALATYTTAVVQCDVADETGVSGNDIPAVVNGQKTTVDINENATKATIGEQGRLTEVYEDCVVMIDTFLAQVTDVVSSETDGNGHLDRQALLELEVYNAYRNQSETVYLTQDTDYTYAEGDMLLVNAYTDNANSYSIAVAKKSVEGYVNQYDLANHLEVAQAAESFVGAQTEDWVNAHKHVIDGETYMDAFRFSLDETFNETDEYNEEINYNWWLDQYGNIIGVTPVARTGYAVLKDLNWVVGNGGYAEATLVYMDGSEDTVQIDTIDGFQFNNKTWAWDNATPILRDAGTWNYFVSVGGVNRVQVSEDSTNNTRYEGYALYQVYTNDDGTVELEGTRLNQELIDYADVATIDVNKSTIWVDSDNDGVMDSNEVEARFDGSTQFIVNNGDGTYSAYTRDTLPTFAEDSLEVFWSLDEGTDTTYASSVYIKDSTLSAEDGTHLFTTTDASYREVGGGVHVIDAVVDGVERTIRTVEDDVINTLMANEGKLFHVTFQTDATLPNYGFVTDVDLVNEAHDGNQCISTNNEDCDYTFAADVVAGDRTITIIDRDGTRESWNTTNTTTIVNLDGTIVDYNIETIEQAVENLSVGIWVVEDENGAAAQIYIGTRLTNDDALDVLNLSTKGATGEWDGNTYEITIPYNANECNVTVAAAAQNAVLVDSANNGYLNPGYKAPETRTLMFNTGLDQGGDSRTATVTVWAEDGVTHTEYTIQVTRAHNDTIDGIINKIQDNSTLATCISSNDTLYGNLNGENGAVVNAGTLDINNADDLSVVFNSDNYWVYYRTYSSTADVKTGDDITGAFWEIPTANLNDVLVLKVVNADGSNFTLADNCTTDAVYIVYNLI
jgi:hypothetical protein